MSEAGAAESTGLHSGTKREQSDPRMAPLSLPACNAPVEVATCLNMARSL